MERLTEMYGGMIVPRKACTFDREGGADDCKECTEICEDEGGVCRTCILQECLTRLGEYEDTSLTPQEIMELAERDTAKEPTKVSDSGVRYTDDYICPNCGKHFIGTGIAEFCYHCGQRLKWEEK